MVGRKIFRLFLFYKQVTYAACVIELRFEIKKSTSSNNQRYQQECATINQFLIRVFF